MYLVASRAGIKTGRKLAKELGFKFSRSANKIPNNSIIAVRYGNAQKCNYTITDLECNSRRSILRMSAKYRLWEYVDEYDILAPRYWKYSGTVPKELEFPILGRNNNHRAGKDIELYNSEDDIDPSTKYLVQFYPTLREYRVHVFDGEVVKVFRKYPDDEDKSDKSFKDNPKIRTSIYGWRYVRSDLDKVLCADKLVDVAKKTSEAVMATFCAIDMAWSRELKRWIVWEVNSAPSLNSSSLELYVALFKKFITGRHKNVIYKSEQNNVRSKSPNRINSRRIF